MSWLWPTKKRSSAPASSMPCDKVIGCELRQSYVEAAYRSMHKDKGGGFEF